MKILLLNTLMEAGGAQKAMLQLARGLIDGGHAVTVVTMYDKVGIVPHYEKQYGLRIVNLGMKRPGVRNPVRRAWTAARGLWRLFQMMRRGQYDVLQTFSHYSNIIGPILGRAAGIRVRVSSQRMSLQGYARWLLRADRVVANSSFVDRMVSVSESTSRFCVEVEGIRPEKLITIPNGIDLDAFQSARSKNPSVHLRKQIGVDPDSIVIITVARLHPQKGHRYLLNAVPAVVAQAPKAVFVLVGDGQLRGEIEESVIKRGIDRYVRILGRRDDVPDLLHISDLFVLPSLWEGMPNAVLEAMAAGLPVVATRVDGTPEVVMHGVTGLLVPPGDAAGLADAIIRVLNDPDRRSSMGREGLRRVKEVFSTTQYVNGFTKLYYDLVQSKYGK